MALPSASPSSSIQAPEEAAPPPKRAEDYPLGRLLRGSHLPALDGLRMVAVLTVILNHIGYAAVPADLGVSIFFVLSGFLITWLLLKERERTGAVSLKTFYLRRLFRLLPAYYVFLAIVLANYYGRSHGDVHPRTDILLPSLLYYANYFNAFHNHPPTPISHTWSLAVEEQFYLLWPLAFSFFIARGRPAVLRFLAISIVLVAAWRSYLFCVVHVGTAYVYNAFDTRFDNLAVGCLAAMLVQSTEVLALAEKISRRAAYPVLTILLIVGSRMMPESYHYSVGFTVEATLLAIAILQIMQLATRPAWRWLSHPASVYVGSISYPMYLYHGLCASLSLRLFPDRVLPRFPLVVALAIVLGTLSFYLVEKPFLRLRKRFTEGRPPREA
jgi:peptidoglycan/LPS O-acetylase OafA/YrhL